VQKYHPYQRLYVHGRPSIAINVWYTATIHEYQYLPPLPEYATIYDLLSVPADMLPSESISCRHHREVVIAAEKQPPPLLPVVILQLRQKSTQCKVCATSLRRSHRLRCQERSITVWDKSTSTSVIPNTFVLH